MKPVTLWYRKGPDGFSFNHLEDGHASGSPTPKHPNQAKAWASPEWRWMHASIDDNGIVVRHEAAEAKE